MLAEAIAFYTLAFFLVFFAYRVITVPNPLHSALYLVLMMIGLAAAFFNLGAQFIAGVQLIVYAGAVMVLFVMVLMLFDLRSELRAFSRGLVSGALKVMSAALLAGIALGAANSSVAILQPPADGAVSADVTKQLGVLLYTKYLFAFEILGVLLLVVAVGVVAVSRMKGGTHGHH
ncbi:MAG TPA: NADH-quinone oxidoreductase subunit J [Bdellovibrionales bacterium]|nr:NADH-quinone oxidoreductase subunit J [Bdellovibrionales bacterium]